MNNEIRERLAQQDHERIEKRREFAEKYLPGFPPDGAAAMGTFDYAWQEGHSSGWHEVEYIFRDLSDILLAAVEELKGR